MASVKLNLDMSKLLAGLQNLPALLGAAPAGAPIPPWVSQYAPLVSMGAQVLGQVVSFDEGPEGLAFPGMPELGPSGKGRNVYLRQRQQFSDAEVSRAALFILRSPVLPAAERLRETVDFALSMATPGVSLDSHIQPSDGQVRAAVDAVLLGTALPEAVADRFGDMLLYTLRIPQNRDAAQPAQQPPAGEKEE